MAAHAGPKIENDGLVFAYDMYNTDKSWKGAPTTNLVASTLVSGHVNIGVSYVGIENGWEKYALSGTWAAAGYPYSLAIGAVSFTGGVTYTTSCLIKTNVPNKFDYFCTGMNYVNQPVNSAGTSFSTTRSNGDIFVGRQGFEYTSTTGQLGYLLSQPLIGGVTFDSGTDFVWIKEVQIEEQPFPTRYTSGTRSTTQAVLDLSKNNYVATASSLTYAADDTFSFASGSADYINIPHASSPVTNLTYEVVINPTTLPAVETYMSVWQKSINWNGTTGISMQFIYGNFGFSFGEAWGGSVSYPQSNFTTGNYYHIVGTVTGNGGTATLYINGIQVDTDVAGTPTDTSDLTVGKGNGGSFNGSMPVFRMYDRCLESTEVAQNFNAIRGRFGI